MYCKNCGKLLDDEAVICPFCGVMVKDVSPKPEFKNGMAIAGFICSFFIPLLGWVFGGIGLSRANKNNGKGKGFSIAAIVVACIMFFIYLGV